MSHVCQTPVTTGKPCGVTPPSVVVQVALSRRVRAGRRNRRVRLALSTAGYFHRCRSSPRRTARPGRSCARLRGSAERPRARRLKLFADDAVWEGVPLGLRFSGVREIRSFLTDWIASYEQYEIQPHEVLDLGGGVVLALVQQQVVRPAGSTTGAPIRGTRGPSCSCGRRGLLLGSSPTRT